MCRAGTLARQAASAVPSALAAQLLSPLAAPLLPSARWHARRATERALLLRSGCRPGCGSHALGAAGGGSPTGPTCVNSSHTSSSVTCRWVHKVPKLPVRAGAAVAGRGQQRAFTCSAPPLRAHAAARVARPACSPHTTAAAATGAHLRVQVADVNSGILVAVVRVLSDQIGTRARCDPAASCGAPGCHDDGSTGALIKPRGWLAPELQQWRGADLGSSVHAGVRMNTGACGLICAID